MKEIIIDTDLGCDCDDAGALAVAFALAAGGQCDIRAVTQCTSRLDAAVAVEVMCRYYGFAHVPRGTYLPDGFLDQPDRKWVDRPLAERFMPQPRSKGDYEDAVAVLRRAIAQNGGGQLTLVSIGPMKNISALLDSPPDGSSSLDGYHLIREKNCRLVAMAGSFDARTKPLIGVAEWNIAQDAASARNVIENWPCEVVLFPFESGVDIRTGGHFCDMEVETPLCCCYRAYGEMPRSSWDQCAVHFAVTGDKSLWDLSPRGRIAVLNSGETVFTPDKNGSRRYIIEKSRDEAQCEIDELMAYIPEKRKLHVLG